MKLSCISSRESAAQSGLYIPSIAVWWETQFMWLQNLQASKEIFLMDADVQQFLCPKLIFRKSVMVWCYFSNIWLQYRANGFSAGTSPTSIYAEHPHYSPCLLLFLPPITSSSVNLTPITHVSPPNDASFAGRGGLFANVKSVASR